MQNPPSLASQTCCEANKMRELQLDPDVHGVDALDNAVKMARDENAYPILLSFYGKSNESGCSQRVDCAEGKGILHVICMWHACFLINAHSVGVRVYCIFLCCCTVHV